MESQEDFKFVEKVAKGASMIGCHLGMGSKLMANRMIDKWKVRLVGNGYLHMARDGNAIISPVIDSASIRLALALAAKYDLEIAILKYPLRSLAARCMRHSTFPTLMANGLIDMAGPDPLSI